MKKNINKNGFSILEIMVWIFIFTIWVVSVYSIIISTLKLNDYNKNYIIATGLAREQLELVRNIRDSNYKKIQVYNQLNPSLNYNTSNEKFDFYTYYKIENNFSTTTPTFPVNIIKIDDFWEWETVINWKMQDYRLCLNSDNLYTHDCSWDNEKTYFYKYIKIDKVSYKDGVGIKNIEDAFKVTSKVIWYFRWYHEFEVTSIFTDFKRF
jgi:hypothetical protein